MAKKPFVCRVELNKEKGIILTVENEGDKTTSTIHMDGKAITIKVKGKETSTFVMKHDSITMKTKTFKVDAETITQISSKASKHTSKDVYTIESTKDTSVTSKAKIVAKASQDMNLEGLKVNIKAKVDLKTDATNTTMKSKAQTKIDAAMFKVNAKGVAEVGGAVVKVAAKGMCDVKGQLTNVKGSILALGAPLIKVG